MTDPTRTPAGSRPATGDDMRMPRWVKLAGALVLALVVLIVGVMLISGGEHGPGRHSGSAGGTEQTTPAGAPDGHVPPEGAH